jgi:hypothetical protein
MAEHKAGLHKKISVIFDGVPIPRDDKPSKTSSETVPERTDEASTKLADALTMPAPRHQQPVKPSSKDTLPKQPDSGGFRQPETVPRKQSGAENAPKNSGQKFRRRIWGQVKGMLFASKRGVNTARQKIIMILIPVLCVIFVLVFINAFSGPSRKTTKQPDVAKAPGKTANSNSRSKINWEIPQPYPADIRDPMQLGPTAASAGTEVNQLVVRGIVYSKDNPSAVIGTQIVHQGDKVSGVTVLEINEDSVEFEADGRTWTQKVQR